MSCGVGCTRGSDPALLWLCYGPVVIAPIQPLAWESPYDMGAAQEMAKRQKKKKKHFIGLITIFSKSLTSSLFIYVNFVKRGSQIDLSYKVRTSK